MSLARADIHMHTTCSDGRHTPPELAEHLGYGSLAVAAVTDHDTIDGALRVQDVLGGLGPEIVIGSEISTADGHVLGLFLSHDVAPGMSAEATIAAIHDQGGLAIAAHPFALAQGVGDRARTLPFDGIELVNGAPLMEPSNHRAHRRLGDAGAAMLGGSDAHVVTAAGGVHTLFEGATADDLRAAIRAHATRPAVDWAAHVTSMAEHAAWLGWQLVARRPAVKQATTA
jgi:predicted metal-dependent phosphoesterase TrpH